MKFRLFLLYILSAGVIGCNKTEPTPPDNQNNYQNGLLVLNEGLFQQNNSSLSWIDLEKGSITEQVFLTENNRPLGDTGNDMAVYGSKLYIVVNASSTVEILDAKTLKSIKQIPLQHNGQGQQPRQIKFHEGKGYITSFDGFVNVLDTTSNSIIDRIEVGQNPEGLSIFGNALYVSNSGGLSFPNVDSTVFKLDLTSHTVVDTFVVGKNPGDIVCDDEGDVYVVKRGDYSSNNPSELIRISNSGTVTNLGISASFIHRSNNHIIISFYDYNSGEGNVSIFNMNTEIEENENILNGSQTQTLYGCIDYENLLFVQDAMNFTNTGYIHKYNLQGSIKDSYSVGLNPTKVIYYE